MDTDNELQKLAVVAVSGGLDSTSLLLHLLARDTRVFGLSFDYGQRHRVEIDRLRTNLDLLASHGYQVAWRLVHLNDLQDLLDSALTDAARDMPLGHYEQDSMRATVVPNRNAIFASILYGYGLSLAERHKLGVSVCLGVHAGDRAIYPDCRPEFYQRLWPAFQLGNWGSERMSLHLPYLQFDKYQILCDAQASCQKLGLDFLSVFRNTWTSYMPDEDGRAHGLTGADVERILAFHQLGVPDPIDYRMPWQEVVARALAVAGGEAGTSLLQET
ncbi:MAG TPA: 7-cyano-7-deazaguanine synthase [Pirellulaceae bacterium]|nr:7-cyano-7-deazaguanine synthase [Pirellulaceae bacterium]